MSTKERLLVLKLAFEVARPSFETIHNWKDRLYLVKHVYADLLERVQ